MPAPIVSPQNFLAPPHKHPHIMRLMPFIVIAVAVLLVWWVIGTFFSRSVPAPEPAPQAPSVGVSNQYYNEQYSAINAPSGQTVKPQSYTSLISEINKPAKK